MSESRKIDQGTVIYGIRSGKYPECACYGIIITARCDIAQHKVPKYYYLVAVDADMWLKSAHGFEIAYGSYINGKRNEIINKANEIDLHGETLVAMPEDSLNIVLTDCLAQNKGNNNITKKISNLKDAINDYRIFNKKDMNTSDRANAISYRPKEAVACLKDIGGGQYHHYHYLPQQTYLQNDVMDKGLVVDLLEIDAMPLEDAVWIIDPYREGIVWDSIPKLPGKKEMEDIVAKDEQTFNKVLDDVAERFRLMNAYWLTDGDSFVDIEGKIASPWCEKMMQRFSNAFVRIGTDDPSESDIKSLVDRIT